MCQHHVITALGDLGVEGHGSWWDGSSRLRSQPSWIDDLFDQPFAECAELLVPGCHRERLPHVVVSDGPFPATPMPSGPWVRFLGTLAAGASHVSADRLRSRRRNVDDIERGLHEPKLCSSRRG